jgi:hypothetical protein
MVKFTLAEAQAYFATRRMRITYHDWDGHYWVEYPNSTFSARRYKTLDGAISGYTHKGEFERWLIGYRGLAQKREAVQP